MDKTIEIKFEIENTTVQLDGKNYNFGSPFQINNYKTFHKYRIPNKSAKAIEFQYNPSNNEIDLIENEVERFCRDNGLNYLCPVNGQNPATFAIHDIPDFYNVLIK